MLKRFILLFCSLLFVLAVLQTHPAQLQAATNEEQTEQLRAKLEKLNELLEKMQQLEALKKPPTEPPWQAVLDYSEERLAYAQYAYLLAPHMQKETLDSILQQLHFFANRDQLESRGTLFVVPALPLAAGETMGVSHYHRELAKGFLQKAGLPSAAEALLLVAPEPLTKPGVAEGPLLLIDLAHSDQILRARILELLQQLRLFDEPEGMTDFLWQLLQQTTPQAFRVMVAGERLQMTVEAD